jgi:hypothetical protein
MGCLNSWQSHAAISPKTGFAQANSSLKLLMDGG